MARRADAPIGALLVDERQAAKLLAVAPRTLQSWRLEGGGPAFIRLSPRAIRYRIVDLERWAADRLATSTSDPGAAQPPGH